MLTKEELAEIQQRYEVKSWDWLELAIEYHGQGEAEFSTNPSVTRELAEAALADVLADEPGFEAFWRSRRSARPSARRTFVWTEPDGVSCRSAADTWGWNFASALDRRSDKQLDQWK